jgi:hypothetical protein
MKGRIKKFRLQSKAVEALRERTTKKKLRMERAKEIKTKPIFVVSISASLKEVPWRFLPNDLSLKTSNTDEKKWNI